MELNQVAPGGELIMSELDDIEVCLQFLVAGMTSESNDARAICAEALHCYGDDALPFLDDAIAKPKSPSVRRRVRAVIERITTSRACRRTSPCRTPCWLA